MKEPGHHEEKESGGQHHPRAAPFQEDLQVLSAGGLRGKPPSPEQAELSLLRAQIQGEWRRGGPNEGERCSDYIRTDTAGRPDPSMSPARYPEHTAAGASLRAPPNHARLRGSLGIGREG